MRPWSIMKKGFAVGFVLLFLGTPITSSHEQMLGGSSSNPLGNTLYVGGSGSGNYTKIQDAIDNASDGDTVFVYDDSSPYYEKVKVDKSIHLVGEDQRTTVIDNPDSMNLLSITVALTADEATFTGFTVRNGGRFIGIDLCLNSNHSTIIGNIFIGNSSPAPLVTAIIISDSTDNIIKENTVSSSAVGVYVYASHDTTITGNNITKNRGYGIELYNARRNTISKNNIMENGDHDASFYRDIGILPLSNHWDANYWGKPHVLPKRIPGQMILLQTDQVTLTLPLVNFDWHPAQKPYVLP